jgi:membrane-bound lytic murein transglycosylase D
LLATALAVSGCAQLKDGLTGSLLPGTGSQPPADTTTTDTAELLLPSLTPRSEAGLGLRAPLRDAARDQAEQRRVERDFWATFLPKLEMEAVDHHQVQAFIRFYRTHEAYLQRVFERGRPFLPYILAELERRDMPADLALLPVVESAFRPFAYSPGRAAGIWQFTPATGRHFGLKQNWWYDGRRDVLAATDAALDYLERLHGRYDSWLLALAAYNAGPGTVNGAIRRNQYRNEATDFWSLDLPRETTGYVPKLLAISHVVRNTEEYGLTLPDIPNRKGFAVVDLEAPLDLARAAELAGIDIETMYRMNPGLNQWCTPPNGPQRLMVPRAKAERFRERLAELDPKERVRWVRHRIQSGETLSEIASSYQTTVGMLKRVNNLAGSRISAGDHLVIPTASSEDHEYALSRPQRLAAIRQSGPAGRTRVLHEVDRGESLWEIAQRFGVQLGQLAEWNGMAPGDTLHAGQQLAVWVPKGDTSGSGQAQRLRYRVRQGDSLWTIAQDFNVPVQRLRSWNGLGSDPIIHPGDRLTIYVDPTRLAEHRG